MLVLGMGFTKLVGVTFTVRLRSLMVKTGHLKTATFGSLKTVFSSSLFTSTPIISQQQFSVVSLPPRIENDWPSDQQQSKNTFKLKQFNSVHHSARNSPAIKQKFYDWSYPFSWPFSLFSLLAKYDLRKWSEICTHIL